MTTKTELISRERVADLSSSLNADPLRNLALAAAAEMRGNPEEALARLENIPAGPDYPEALAARAQIRIELKQFGQAVKDLEQLAVLRPGDAEAASLLGYCYYQLSRFEDALQAFRASDALVSQGICLLRMKQPEEALERFEKALQQPDDSGAALLGKATALQMSYELEEAVETYRQLLERNPRSRDALTNLVILGLQKKDDSLVHEHARGLLSIDQDSEIALAALANISFNAGAFEAAALHSTHLVRLYPDRHDYWFNLGVAEERRNNFDAAAVAFENAGSADPSSAAAFLACASVYEQMGDDIAARRSLERAVRVAPQRSDLRYQIGVLAEKQGMPVQAENAYLSVVSADPGHLKSRFRLGYMRLEAGDFKAAAEQFEACLATRPQWKEAEVNLALAYSKLGRAKESEAILAGLLQREPEYRPALRGAAVSLDSGALKNLCDAGDKSPEVLFNSGVAHQQAGDWRQAAECYREALAANPDFAEALVNLGHALMASGDEDGAHESWAAAVEKKPELARGYFLP
jgi:tetratricopeptide (TPR) repeat protein